jgi:hypothetical protein
MNEVFGIFSQKLPVAGTSEERNLQDKLQNIMADLKELDETVQVT